MVSDRLSLVLEVAVPFTVMPARPWEKGPSGTFARPPPGVGVWTPVRSFRGYTDFAVTIDLPRVDPNFVMATLVRGLDAKHLTIDLECTVHSYLPFGFGTWWHNNPHTSDHSSGSPPGPTKV